VAKTSYFSAASTVRQTQRRGHRIIRTSTMRGRPAATMSNLISGTRPAPYVPEDIIAQVSIRLSQCHVHFFLFACWKIDSIHSLLLFFFYGDQKGLPDFLWYNIPKWKKINIGPKTGIYITFEIKNGV
jgi:hypothetical protein